MNYRYCSICGGRLKKQGQNLACVKCPFVNYRNPRPTVTGLVLHKNKLLLTRRAKAPFKNWWDLPGGFMERGEKPTETLRRELKEETNLDIVNLRLFGFYPGTYPSVFDSFHVLNIAYLADSKTSSLKALDDVNESRWFSKRDLPKTIAFDSNRSMIKDFLKIWN